MGSGLSRATLGRYDHFTESFGYGTDLIIWPEAATPFVYEREPLYQLQLVAMAIGHRRRLLFGSPALRFDADRKPYLLNSAYLLSPEGSLLGRYDKQHLVPFGEYIPLKSSALFFLDKLVEGIGDFQAGPGPTILSIQPKMSDESRPQRPVKFGVLICYEVIFPDLVRHMAAAGAEFLVTITNDAWFGDSSAPAQHFSMVVFRSVENHRAFARAANTGISGFIDPFGRIIKASPIFMQTALQSDHHGSAAADVLQPIRRCLCLWLYDNLPAASVYTACLYQGGRTGRYRGHSRLKGKDRSMLDEIRLRVRSVR